jgi:hypothetical protein
MITPLILAAPSSAAPTMQKATSGRRSATAPANSPEIPAKRGLTKARHPPNGRGSLTSNWYGPFV